jgi:phosphohistidine swiveling domain-containing protein
MGVGKATDAPPEFVPAVVDLKDEAGQDPDVAGAKAAALARARAAGMPVLPGFAVTTAHARAFADGQAAGNDLEALRSAWRQLSDAGSRSLVVRSSSTAEDGGSQSMAGMFTSVLDVRGWESFLDALGEVVHSGGDAPIAALVQPFLEPAWGGVLFGADPVTGRTDRLVVAAVPGGPDRLVSGQVDGAHLTLSPRGRLRDASDDTPDGLRRPRTLQALARLARQAAATFGGPQDIEWAIEADGTIVLLQSRPITAVGDEARASGPVLGPGPVAETFGTALRTLEEDLWVAPLRDGLREALTVAGTSPARKLRTSPIVVTVGGWVAADLDLLGLARRRKSFLSRFDPRPPARRLKAAWRVGRLKVALPSLADDLVARVDLDLRSLPDLRTMNAFELVRVLRRSHQTLVALHGHEVLAGLLLGDGEDDDRPTAASAALRVLAEARSASSPVRSADDEDLVARHPVLLSLVPPSIGAELKLPPPPASLPSAAATSPAGSEAAVREALRLRVRWVHEATARATLALGDLLVARGVLPTAAAVVNLRLDELAALAEGGGALVLDLRETPESGAPLPASFRLTDDGIVVPVATGSDDGGRGAGGGRGSGPVHVGTDTPPSPGDVLIVRTLDPALASVLPGLSGLVAETGSVLSHLAILAREYGVPTVVGAAGAVDRFTNGTWVVVDGSTGEVSAIEAEEWGAA